LRPSVQPNFCNPCRKPAKRACSSGSPAALLMSTPTRRIRSACCARAARGPARAATPKRVMNSRRRMGPLRTRIVQRPKRNTLRPCYEREIGTAPALDAVGRTSPSGHSRRLKHLAATSAITLNADIRLRCNICRKGPIASLRTAEKQRSFLRSDHRKVGHRGVGLDKLPPRRAGSALPANRQSSMGCRQAQSASSGPVINPDQPRHRSDTADKTLLDQTKPYSTRIFAGGYCGNSSGESVPEQSICPLRSAAKTAPRPGTRRYFFSAGRPYIPTRVALASVWKCSSNPTSAADTLWSLAYCSFSSSTANTVKM
jgi:hypothetical protein